MALTAEQISDIHFDLGTDSGVFSDVEIERLWVRTQASYAGQVEANQLVYLRIALCTVLRNNATKLYDYQVAQNIEKQSQVFDHLSQMISDYQATLGVTSQVFIVGQALIPPRPREVP